jgi:hypothetical protein
MIKGQKVVCVNDTFTPTIRALYQQLPVKDNIYTIREVFLGREKIVKGGDSATVGLLLEELVNPKPIRFTKGNRNSGFRRSALRRWRNCRTRRSRPKRSCTPGRGCRREAGVRSVLRLAGVEQAPHAVLRVRHELGHDRPADVAPDRLQVFADERAHRFAAQVVARW